MALYRKFFITAVFLMVYIQTKAQTVLGTPGLMNIPTAEIREGGTFDGGVSLMQRELLTKEMDYNTWLYYVYFAPFSFIDVTLRETLLKYPSVSNPEPHFCQQDRSLSVRVLPIKEKPGRWWPSVLIGVNDFYSDQGGSFYAAAYGVVTKSLAFENVGTLTASVGYSRNIREGVLYDGVFGGASLSPSFAPTVRLMGEYDTRGINVGLGAQLFRHLNLTCFTREFKGISATASYQYTIPY
jgi:hypothetical protein